MRSNETSHQCCQEETLHGYQALRGQHLELSKVQEYHQGRPYLLRNLWRAQVLLSLISRTKDIESGLDIVQRHLAQKKQTAVPASRPAEMDIVYRTSKTQKQRSKLLPASRPAEHSSSFNSSRAVLDSPYNSSGVLERNLTQNFEPDYL